MFIRPLAVIGLLLLRSAWAHPTSEESLEKSLIKPRSSELPSSAVFWEEQRQQSPVKELPYGKEIEACTVDKTIALTFDDGPSENMIWVLDQLKDAGLKATFFLCAYEWRKFINEDTRKLLKRMHKEGHQIGHHTFSHSRLTNNVFGREGIIREMKDLDRAFISTVGFAPTYMRPPFLSTNREVLDIMEELEYHVIMADADTNDWANNKPDKAHKSVERFREKVEEGNRLILAHEKYEHTTRLLVPAMIEEVKRRGLRAVTVGECLGDPEESWYRVR